MEERVRMTMDGGIAHVTLARPDRMNALDNAMFDALIAVGTTLMGDTAVRCVVLSGEGRAFCAGLDKEVFAATDAMRQITVDRLAARTHGIANREQYAAWVWRELPVPVIAAIHGVAFGGGLQVALGADLRYVRADTRLSVMEVKWGLVPDMAGTVLMRGLLRDDVARELTYTGRIFSGVEAGALGLATRVCENPVAEAFATAKHIAASSPTAVRAAKRLFNDLSGRDAAAALLAESLAQADLLRHAHHREAVAANLADRAPNFD